MIRFWLVYVLVPIGIFGAIAGGPTLFLLPAVVFGLIPLLDRWMGTSDADSPGPDLPLRLWVPLQLVLIGLATAFASRWDLLDRVGVAINLGLLTGAGGITIAHELVHRSSKRDQWLGEVLMTSVSYPWFCTEHVLGHHRHVGTLRDPATARFGESVYRFLPRTLVGSFVSFWALERERTARRGIGSLSLANRRLRYALGLGAAWAVAGLLGGTAGLAMFGIQSAVAVLLLEVINYVEHYGLVRAPGERVEPRHSWNSRYWLTAGFLFNLPRHADHHANASRPFGALRAVPDAPELPYGYATMVVVALFPPLWFRWMDGRVAAARAMAVADRSSAR